MPDLEHIGELELGLIQELADRLAQVMASMTGGAPQTRCEPVRLSAEIADPDQLWWQETLSVSVETVIWVGASRRSWEEIGKQVLAAAGVDNPSAENAKTTWQEVLNQALSGFAEALASRVRKEIVCLGGEEGRPPETSTAGFTVALILQGTEIPFHVVFHPALLKIVEKPEVAVEDPPPQTDKKSRSPGQPDSVPTIAPEPHPSTIDLLLDVELPVSVSFGRAQLPLKEVIKLTTGSIVELNRTILEPVEVIVNNCVIARGQVVVVEGNFGIRIEQVISRQERLRTLK